MYSCKHILYETRNIFKKDIQRHSKENIHLKSFVLFVAVFLGCTSTGRVGLWVLLFSVQEHPKAQPAVALILKRLRRRGNGLKSHPTDWEKPRGGGGDTLIFSAYVGSYQAPALHPINISGISSTPNNI